MLSKNVLPVAGALLLTAGVASGEPAAPPPVLEYAFSAQVEVAPAVEVGDVDGGRRRFIPITGGKVEGSMLAGTVMANGGDWQIIRPGGLTELDARYFIKTADGAVIEVANTGVRVASPQVIDRLARGDNVDPSSYYFRTTPRFTPASPGKYDWMRRVTFVARGIRRPDRVLVDFYVVR